MISDSVLQILLYLKEDGDMDIFSSSTEQILEQNGIATESLGPPFVTDVAKFPPLTRGQFNQASKLWPVNFHEDKWYGQGIRLVQKKVREEMGETEQGFHQHNEPT